MTHDDPFDLDDHRPRVATNRDRLLAAGVREVERQRAAKDEPTGETVCPECHGYCVDWDDKFCTECNGTGVSPASALSRAWEAVSDEGQAAT